MIRRLRGTVLESTPTSVVLDVGGVGYLLTVSATAAITAESGTELSLYTYLAVRENALELYGFPNSRDLSMFLLLIELPGIGPKTAINILSQADTRLLEESARSNDAAYLSKLSGIGKKSAEKIVAGLKDKFSNEDALIEDTDGSADVVDALIALGYSHEEARRALREIPKELTDTRDRLKEALRTLGS